MSDEKKQYKVIQPVAFGGRREIGEVLELTDEEAQALGSEFVETYISESSAEDTSAESSEEQGSGNEAAPESEPATAGESLEPEEDDSEQ